VRSEDPETPRDLGPLRVDDRLGAALAELRRRGQVQGPAELDADRLHAVEVAVSFRFAPDLLATWAAAVPLLLDRHELALDKVVAHTARLRSARAPGDLIGLGVSGDDFLCIEKRTAAGGATSLHLYRPSDRRSRATPLCDWLEALVADLPLPSGAPAPEPLVFRLTRKPPTGSSGRLVRHPVFGEGRVYLEIGTGPDRKVKVDFPKVGLKLLQARFLEYLD
jgi:hypothetical protein